MKTQRLIDVCAITSTGLALAACWRAFDWHSGEVADWLSGLGSISAALAALWIATRDRSERRQERRAEQAVSARLVQLSVRPSGISTITVQIRNYGPMPVLDVEIVEATWSEHPEARPESRPGMYSGPFSGLHQHPILLPHPAEYDDSFNTLIEYHIDYMQPDADDLVIQEDPEESIFIMRDRKLVDVSKVTVKIRFTSADNVRWEMPSEGTRSGDPVRL